MPDFGDRRIMACSPADLKRWLGELCGLDDVMGSIPARTPRTPARATQPLRASSAGQEPAPRPGTAGQPPSSRPGAVGSAMIEAEGLALSMHWRVLEPRRIALLRIEQLELVFDYPREQAQAARAWIARFDRHTQRGGG